MKKIITVALTVVSMASVMFAFGNTAQKEMSLAQARSKITELVSTPESIGGVMAQLSADNQKKFVSDINAAISNMRATVEEKAAKFYAVNKAILVAPGTKSKGSILAEIFAVVPTSALAVINERFASDLFNRAADPSRTYSDDEFTKIAQKSMSTIIERCEKADDASIRQSFAILMFVRASNGTPKDLDKTLVQMIPSKEAREIALDEWIGPALGKTGAKSYEPMLGVTDAGESIDVPMTLGMIGPSIIDVMFHDLASQSGVASQIFHDAGTGLPQRIVDLERMPRTLNPEAPFYPSNTRPGYQNQEM